MNALGAQLFFTYPNNILSPIIVKRMENLLSTVNIGRLQWTKQN